MIQDDSQAKVCETQPEKMQKLNKLKLYKYYMIMYLVVLIMLKCNCENRPTDIQSTWMWNIGGPSPAYTGC